jgi:hypothetical protein
MALAKKTNTARKSDMAQADAFLNLAVTDSNGVQHRLPKGLALYLKDKVSRSMINAQIANNDAAAKAGTEPVAITFQLTGTIWIQPEESGTDLTFG